ncbi:MAG: MBL fold metallo-hydrolase, partial [Bacillota bacterium]|nr:MBL fold metallo-hydrolase [Bacillota bacterium]
MRFATICSGSSGNCVYVGGGKTHVLVDGGCSLKALKAALSQFSVGEGALKALFITHEHTDHINGAARIAKHFGIPVFASEQTWEKLPFREDFFPWQRHKFEYGMEIGELGLDFFRLSHDAVQPVGMLFEHAGKRVAVA